MRHHEPKSLVKTRRQCAVVPSACSVACNLLYFLVSLQGQPTLRCGFRAQLRRGVRHTTDVTTTEG